jgi:hypothetical protein
MLLSRSARDVLAGCCFALSAVWAAAGALKLVFGVRITFVILPPLDLTQIAPARAFWVAVGWMVLGALLGRAGRRRPRETTAEASRPAPSA